MKGTANQVLPAPKTTRGSVSEVVTVREVNKSLRLWLWSWQGPSI